MLGPRAFDQGVHLRVHIFQFDEERRTPAVQSQLTRGWK